MIQEIYTNYKPCQIEIVVVPEGNVNTRVYLTVFDKNDSSRLFTNRYKDIGEQTKMIVQMPLSSKYAKVKITNKAGNEHGFKVLSCNMVPLEKRMAPSDIKNPAIQEFLTFAGKIAYNLQNLEPKVYKSSGSNFYVDVVQRIAGPTGNELNTPARISPQTGIIQISQNKLRGRTIPYIMAILMHEFSHYYLNEEMRNEEEADMNGLLIYLAIGYPRIEAYQAFYETFKGNDTEPNRRRMQKIDTMIRNFDNMKMVIR